MRTLSLRKRLLVTAAFILITFLGLAGLALDRAFISSAKVSVRDQLRTQTFALLSVLEVAADGEILLPKQLPEGRLLVPNSGLYAVILDQNATPVWQSASTLGVHLDNLETTLSGSEEFRQDGQSLNSPFRYSFAISWETEDNVEHEFTMVMIEASDLFISFVNEHRRKIVLWLGLAGVVLLLLQMAALRWSLAPLARVMNELDQIEHAKQDRIMGIYPDEIAQLSERINQFIARERKNLERYRNTLGDLAHSLKTPLAVIRGLADSESQVQPSELSPYVDRMDKIVDYQLKRADASRVSLVQKMINVSAILEKVEDSLNKVYAEKAISVTKHPDQSAQFYGDQSDLYELIGNVLDNAYKWSNGQIGYRCRQIEPLDGYIPGVEIVIEDDGPGVDKGVSELIFQRGVRADQKVEGQGIGLAVCQEIIERYNGNLDFSTAAMGGASVRIVLYPMIADA